MESRLTDKVRPYSSNDVTVLKEGQDLPGFLYAYELRGES